MHSVAQSLPLNPRSFARSFIKRMYQASPPFRGGVCQPCWISGMSQQVWSKDHEMTAATSGLHCSSTQALLNCGAATQWTELCEHVRHLGRLAVQGIGLRLTQVMAQWTKVHNQ